MANEQQRLTLSQPRASLEDGIITVDYEGTTAGINWNDDAAAAKASIESLITALTGNITVTAETSGFLIEFINTLAETNVSEMTVADCTLKADASTISTAEVQPGISDPGGQPQKFSITLNDSPTEGTLVAIIDGNPTSEFDFNGTGVGNAEFSTSDTGPVWVYERSSNDDNQISYSASEGTTPLRKAVTGAFSTPVQGGVGGVAMKTFFRSQNTLLRM